MIKLGLRGFMRHAKLDVELPDRGVILVTGKNGSGKSTLIEAVSYGLWGRTLRGTEPWPEGGGEMDLEVDACLVSRACNASGRKTMHWSLRAGDELLPQTHQTATKAQEALDHLVGPWEVWRRTSVFSSQDAAHFTMATDGERKRLLESLLGLDRFDVALEMCRADRAQAERAEVAAQAAVRELGIKIEAEERRLKDAEAMLQAQEAAVSVPAGDPAKLADLAASADKERRAAQGEGRQLDMAGAEQAAQAQEVERRLERLSSGKCPTCAQSIPPAMVEGLRVQASALKVECAAKRVSAQEQLKLLAGRVAELEEEWRELSGKASRIDAASKAAQRMTAARDQAQRTLGAALAELQDLCAKLAAAKDAATSSTQGLGTMQAVESVLGLRGVRAHILGKALGGLEAVADGWLSRIAGGKLHVKLSPCTEKKGGGTMDAISLEIQGAGGGLGYRAASGGERRRIDVALLMALAEMAGAARSTRAPDLLAFDEVFDALDPDGVEAVASAVMDLASTRPVMVITHNPALAQAVQAGVHIEMGG